MSKKFFDPVFKYLCILGVLFLLWQVVMMVVNKNPMPILTFMLMDHHFSLPFFFVVEFLFFCAAQIGLYIIFAFWIWCISREIALFLRLSSAAYMKCALALWVLGVAGILLANQVFLPLSLFSRWMDALVARNISYYLFVALFLMFGFSTLSAGILFIRRKYLSHQKWVYGIGAAFLIAIGFGENIPVSQPVTPNFSKPNIIMIGMDALRPDRLNYYGYAETKTPTIDAFLKQSVRVEEAITPIARTFPSWSSILTGQNPIRSSIRDNLVDLSKVNFDYSLPSLLRKAGYETIYASDQVRFSNITPQFGFDHIISVQPGVGDFTLGSINDFPLANLVINTSLGRWLFPYSYANDGAFLTYQPMSFVHELFQSIGHAPKKPTFLAMHLCLTHYPYLWAASTKPGDSGTHLYDLSVSAIDSQLKSILDGLKARGYLDNAIVVLLSDHGETFALQGDRSIDRTQYVSNQPLSPKVFQALSPLASRDVVDNFDTPAGHGTDILSYPQYRMMLAFQGFGKQQKLFHSKDLKGLASAIDLKPTLLDLVGVKDQASDGISLKKALENNGGVIPDRPLFAEIAFTPSSIRSNHIVVQDVVYQAIDAFYVEKKTGYIVFRPEMLSKILKTRQRAVYFKEWILAVYPTVDSKGWIPVLANRYTHQWTDDLTTGFARHSPIKQMLQAFDQYYAKEVRIRGDMKL